MFSLRCTLYIGCMDQMKKEIKTLCLDKLYNYLIVQPLNYDELFFTIKSGLISRQTEGREWSLVKKIMSHPQY